MKRILRAGLLGLSAAPERLLRASFGDPPRSDRGIEQDLRTHVMLSLTKLARLGELHHLPPAKARRHYEKTGALADLPPTPLAEQRDFELPGPGGPLPCRLYRPRTGLDQLPILVWLHGGGFVIGGLDTHAHACAALASGASCLVVAVDYRKSPEHKFPAASDDALASFRWIRDHAKQLGGDPERVALGGDSAGANLSAGLCHRLRDADDHQPTLQVLLYPMTRSATPERAPGQDPAAHAGAFPSRSLFAEGALLTGDMIEWFHRQYLDQPEDAAHPLVSPLLSPRFDDLAPAIIRTCGFDPLRDEGQAYAETLRAAGVPVDYRCHERLIHGYLTMGGASPGNRAAILGLGDDLAAAFA